MNKPTLIYLQVCVWTHISLFFGENPDMELLGHVVGPGLTAQEAAKPFPKAAAPLYSSARDAREVALHLCQHLALTVFSILAILLVGV